jgi:D-alanyl-D-alanine carboxypeptidase/D-alanyl-D-alanine-endopeptidase (penicillin-binding protein 4)
MTHSWRALPLLALLGGCAALGSSGGSAPGGARDARAALRFSIDSMVGAPEFRSASWGVLIVDPVAAETLYSHNASRLFIPASNQKLVSSSVALEQLGPDYRYRTTFGARGTVAGGTLAGDLAVVGRGDPTTSDHMKHDAMQPLREIADSVWHRGVRHITGSVVATGNAFPGPVAGFGWPWDGLDATSYAGVDELLFNEGLSTIRVRAGGIVGDSARIETAPARTVPRIRNAVSTVALPGIAAGGAEPPAAPVVRGRGRGGPGTHLIAYHDTTSGGAVVVVRGEIALGDSATIVITQHDPDDAYVAALTEALRDRGVVVDGQPPRPESERVDSMFTVSSVPLREIMPMILKPSQNQIAEVFLRTIGLERTGVGTADSGRRVIERQFADWKIPADGFVVRDGSGLSRSDYISPEAIVGILEVMRRSPNFDVFFQALPIAGVDGTIGSRMRDTPAQGNLHAKTGTLPMVRSLSGYVRTADGRLLEFSILCNAWTTPQTSVDRVADSIGVALASMTLGARP